MAGLVTGVWGNLEEIKTLTGQDLVRIAQVVHTRWEATFGLDILPESVCEITASLITE